MSVTTPESTTAPSQSETLAAILGHHAQLSAAVSARAAAVVDAAERLADVTPHRDAFVELLRDEVLPHAVAEEQTLYRAGATLAPSRLLVGSMVMEHRRLMALVDDLEAARTPVGMAANALAVRVLFEAHRGDLDVRSLPHAARHERIFGVVSQLVPGEAFVLANDHDPKPLRYQLEAQNPGQITWDYLEQGPELWRVQIGRI
jgi:uncharacterized protein (DUF2249 family)